MMEGRSDMEIEKEGRREVERLEEGVWKRGKESEEGGKRE